MRKATITPKEVITVHKMDTAPALPGEPGVSESHTHEWRPDPITGEDEELCRCGLWRCAQVDGRSGKRCKHAAIDVFGRCRAHNTSDPNKAADWMETVANM